MRIPIYYDASHIVHFGPETPVGVARVDQYVAGFLARDPGLSIDFIVFDAGLGGFRRRTDDEAARIERSLSHRIPRDTPAPASSTAEPNTPAIRPEAARGRTEAGILHRVRLSTKLPRAEFDHRLTVLAGRVLPVKPQHGVARRLATRVVRRSALACARGAYFVGCRAAAVSEAARHLARPDPTIPPAIPPQAASGVATAVRERSAMPCDPDDDAGHRTVEFGNGAIVLSMANCWDYLDYAYLHRICRYAKVRFIVVIYDVIAMQFPYTTPSPAHIYHRHWVEVGHCAAHLLAISAFSAAQYAAFIGEPNDLCPPLSHARLPDFLRDRAPGIGEAPIARLLGRRFVLFCSTIETRKNHQMLIQLWDRLRLEFGPDRLPILVFAGKWGWGTETVRLLSEHNFHLRRSLLILNRVSDAELIWLYRRARFTVFPALSEGYGLGAAESLAFGTPAVISDCPALVEATEGLMPSHDPLDFMAWLAELRALIRDDQRLGELREAAARYRGAGHDDFARAIRAIAMRLADATPQRLAAD